MPKKILIIRFSSIGDIVLASPVFRCVKQQLPGAEVHFLTKSNFSDVTIHNPYIDRFFYLEEQLEPIIELLKKEEYDHVIDLHNNIRSIKVRKALKRPVSVINKLSYKKFLLTKLKLNLMPRRHITQRSLDAAAPLGVKDDGKGLDFFISPENEVKQADIPASHHLGYIAMVIGANHFTKKMPLDKWRELCNLIDHPIMLLGGKTEKQEGEEIAAIDPIKIYNSCGKFSLQESADLVRKSKLVISHDTGLQYIACAFQKPLIAIWGGTSPKLDVEPYYGSGIVGSKLTAPYENVCLNLWCQPCSKYGKSKCPLGHFKCMKNHDLQAIALKVKSYLGR
jgi:ADP-heptose:LPS heptosyltransferase